MSTEYTMSCWNSTRNPDVLNKAKLLSQCLGLVKALQTKLTDGEIVVPSRDKDESKKGIEIMVWYKSGAGPSFFDDVRSFLTQTANSRALDYREFVTEQECLTRYFSEDEVKNIQALKKTPTFNPTEKDVQDILNLAKDSPSLKGVSGKNISEPFQITSERLIRLRQARDDVIMKELIGIMDTLNSTVNTTKTGWGTLLMIGAGVITLGSWASRLPAVWGGVVMVVEVIPWLTAIVGVTVMAGFIAALIAIIVILVGGLYLALKDCMNILLVVNDTPNETRFVGDQVINGERETVTVSLPPKQANNLVWAGFFVYRKWNIGGTALGFYGSLFGACLSNTNTRDISIGMDCPNSILGGSNSVRMCKGRDPVKAASLANESGNSDDQIRDSGLEWRAKRANGWGNINWAVCTVATT